MSERYEHDPIELKWQKRWEEAHCNEAKTDYTKPKFYGLIEFPYPSGQGLHVGHPRPFTAMDVICRKRRLEGYNVLFPMGYDAFGLPTENYAIKTGIHPAKVTETNIARFRAQLKRLGYSFDWSREISTADPEYYKWTQWIFLKLYEHGLAYKAEIPINFCTSCKVGLANEEVVDGVCERCGGQVIQMVRSQWMLKITEYAQKLIDDLDKVDYIERVKTQQRNWIGRSEGAEVDFIIANTDDKLTVYTTRPDTLFGATYMVISPEHPYIDKYKDRITNWDAVAKYREEAAHKSDFERGELNKEKTGVVLEGVSAINPVTKKEIPIWVSDYVLMSYGTGAIMAVPAHDTRDYEFAKTFNLPIVEVVAGGDVSKEAYTECEHGRMVNSGFLNGMEVAEAKKAIADYLEKEGIGHRKVNYKLRDWVFARQRYWGEPIPLVKCEKCGWVPLPESELPLKLPMLDDFSPTDDGSSCLARAKDWLHTTCPHCGGKIVITKGIEVGQVFKLGTKYSEALGATYLDNNGKSHPMVMGCYGIGVTRTVAASIEQNHDDDGIIWPVAIAPYEVVIVPANNKSEEVMDAAKKLYDAMEEKADEVVLDDRNERAGIKFKDADLIGYPVRVTIGKKWQQSGNVEIRLRRSGETIEVPYEECKAKVMEILAELHEKNQ